MQILNRKLNRKRKPQLSSAKILLTPVPRPSYSIRFALRIFLSPSAEDHLGTGRTPIDALNFVLPPLSQQRASLASLPS